MTSSTDVNFSKAIHHIYAAGIEEGSWDTALTALCDFIGARAIDVTAADPNTGAVSWFQPARIDEFVLEYVADFQQDLMNLNPRIPVYAGLEEGQCLADSDVWTAKEKARMPFFGELILPWGTHNSLMAFVKKTDSSWIAVAAHFDKKAGIPQQDTREKLVMMLPHLRRSYLTQLKLGEARGVNDGLIDSLDRISQAVLILDVSGKVVRSNRRAMDLLKSSKTLSVNPAGRLVIANPRHQDRLLHILSGCGKSGTFIGPSGPDITERLVLNRPVGLPLTLSLSPINRISTDPCEAVAVAFIHDPDSEPLQPSSLYSLTYGLTPAEVKLLLAILEGLSLRQYADSRGIAYETVRTQLKAVFAKTGARRQSDLIRLMASKVV